MAQMVVAGVQITVDGVPMPGSFTQHQEMIEVEVGEALRPIGGEVDVIVPTEPPTAFRGRIVSVDYRSGWGRARSCIEQVRAPREVNAPS